MWFFLLNYLEIYYLLVSKTPGKTVKGKKKTYIPNSIELHIYMTSLYVLIFWYIINYRRKTMHFKGGSFYYELCSNASNFSWTRTSARNDYKHKIRLTQSLELYLTYIFCSFSSYYTVFYRSIYLGKYSNIRVLQ